MTSKENMRKNNRTYYQRHKEEILKRRKAKREDYKNQLTKAKEIIKELMSFSVQLCDCRHTVDFEKTREQAVQFLKEIEK